VFSRDGTKLLVGKSANGPGGNLEVVTLIDTQSGKIRATLDNPNGPASTTEVFGPGGPRRNASLRPVSFTTEGKQFILADDNVIRTFDSLTGKLINTLRGHESAVVARAEGRDGSLWSVEDDGTLKQWDLQPPEPVRIGAAGKNVVATPLFALSANGAWVARVHVEKEDMKDEYRSIVEVWDTAGTKEAKVFQKVDGPRGNRTQFFPNAGDPTAVALSADGQRVALLRPAAFPPLAKDEKDDPANPRKPIAPADLTVWDVASGKEVYHREVPAPRGTDVLFYVPMFTPDGATMTVVQRIQNQDSLRVFDITNRREKQAIDYGGVGTTSTRLSPDGQRVATVTWKSLEPAKVAVYDLATGKRQEIDARVSRGSNLTWSPDGRRLLVTYQSGAGNEINLYDTATGKLSASLYTADQLAARDESPNTWITSMGPVFSPDGRRVAGVARTRQSGVIKVWDTESGKDLLTIPLAPMSATVPLRGNLYHLAFTPENHKLVAVTTQAYRGGGPAFGDPSAPIRVTTYDATPRPEPAK
jgi:WD40 repeat protein